MTDINISKELQEKLTVILTEAIEHVIAKYPAGTKVGETIEREIYLEMIDNGAQDLLLEHDLVLGATKANELGEVQMMIRKRFCLNKEIDESITKNFADHNKRKLNDAISSALIPSALPGYC